MAQSKQQPRNQKEDSHMLRGTLASVMILGGFILLSWFGIFALYLARM